MISVVADKELLPWNHNARHRFWKVHHVDLRVNINSYAHCMFNGFLSDPRSEPSADGGWCFLVVPTIHQ